MANRRRVGSVSIFATLLSGVIGWLQFGDLLSTKSFLRHLLSPLRFNTLVVWFRNAAQINLISAPFLLHFGTILI